MKNILSTILIFSCLSSTYAQIAIKANNTAPIPSAQLEVQSTTKAFYPPRMTTSQRTNMPITPQEGATVFDTDLNGLFVFDGVSWVSSGLTLPYSAVLSSNINQLIAVNNQSTSTFLPTITSKTNALNGAAGIEGEARNSFPTGFTSGVTGRNYSNNSFGAGILGDHNGGGFGIYARSQNGIGGYFTSPNGYALITDIGNVGIGTSTPNAPLQFSNAALNRKVVLYETANNDHQFYGLGINGFTFRYQVGSTSDAHVFYAGASATTSNELMRIRGDGNVGIGINTPNAKLHIVGSVLSANPTGLTSASDNTTNPPTAPVSGAGTRMMWIPTRSAFRVGSVYGSESAYWDAASVGLFSFASGANNLASGKWSTSMGSFNIANGTNATSLGAGTTASGYAATSMGLSTTASGDYATSMGYFNTAQAYTSVVMGRYNVVSGNSGAWISSDPLFVIGNGSDGASRNNAFVVLKNGNVVVDGNVFATNFVQSSDVRFKKNIKALENPLDNILKIEGVRYDWRREEFPERHFSEKNQIGFIAQDLEKIFPEMVFTDEKGFKSVDYARLTPVLVEAVKELSIKNEILEEKVSAMQNLKTRLEKLETLLAKTDKQMSEMPLTKNQKNNP